VFAQVHHAVQKLVREMVSAALREATTSLERRFASRRKTWRVSQ